MLTDWHPLGAILYRKWNVYDMDWPDERRIENYAICGAPFGGPIAMVLKHPPRSHDDADEESSNSSVRHANCLSICSSAGLEIGTVELESDKGKSIVGMGWSDHEHLITVLENGLVKIYDIRGKLVAQFSLIEGSTNASIVECHFWGNGIAAMSSLSIVHVAEGLSASELGGGGPRVYMLQTGLGVDRTYTSMAIIQPLLSRSGLLEVLVGTSDSSVLVLHETQTDNVIEDQLLQLKIGAPIVKFAVAPNGRFLACYRSDGILTVLSSAFTTKVLDFDAQSLSPPLEIAWCGEDAVVMQWRNTGIIMVGPYGDWLNFPYDSSAVHLVAEPDCCRIITSFSCEILQRVPSSTAAIRSVGSTDPAALMFDAMEAFEEGDPKADENIKSIAESQQLGDAVTSCVLAAASEFDVANQKAFLKAASYGKAFCPESDPGEFVRTAQKLRVLNAVRARSVGLPLTVQQYDRLTPEVLVGRLTMRRQHFLALKICELLKLKTERVLVHWACEKIRQMSSASSSSPASDEEVNRTIKQQLERYERVSYLAIAEAAYSMGRRRLATLLIDREQHAGDQIPLLLRMNEEELALQKAVSSGDTDLIYYTLISLETRILRGNSSQNSSGSGGGGNENMEFFLHVVLNHVAAANLLKIYYRSKATPEDRRQLHQLLVYSRNYYEAGAAAVTQALQQGKESTVSKLSLLREATQLFGAGGSKDKDAAYFKGAVEEQMDLMDLQRNLEIRSQPRRSFAGLSVVETMEQLLTMALQDPMEARWTESELAKMVKKFKVSDKVLWYLKVRLYSEFGAWGALNGLAQEKKSPIGYKPFARACMKYERPAAEVERYIEKISGGEDRFEMFVELRSWYKAADVAAKLKDPQRLQEVAHLCQDPSLERHIQEIVSKL